ncbi:MAG: helix-turn-helix domain-containing protein [Clostridia bacterium]|nr:helix-turn-helix domain-containing protein [Clostridia bacterium]
MPCSPSSSPICEISIHGLAPGAPLVCRKGEWAIIAVLGGSAECQTEEKEYPLRKGDFLFIPPELRSAWLQGRNARLCTLRFRLDALIGPKADIRQCAGFSALFSPAGPALVHAAGTEGAEIEYLLSKALQEAPSDAPGAQSCLNALMVCLLVALVRLRQRSTADRPDADPLSPALSYMEEHFTEEITLPQLAALSDTSPRHFDRLFRAAYQVTPKQYIAQLRIARACAMLAHTNRPITEIAFDCGYADSNYFSRVFRKIRGISPQQYRQTPERP